MTQAIFSNLKDRMNKSIDAFKEEVAKLRTGRAHPSLVEGIMVEYYGNPTPMSQVANISAPEARMLLIQPWDQGALSEIEKALLKSDLGVSPQNDGRLIRLPLPPLTEERRKDLVKQASKISEEAKVAIRNIRRDGMDDLKTALKNKEITEDDQKKGQDQIQKLTDEFIATIDQILESKSKDILTV